MRSKCLAAVAGASVFVFSHVVGSATADSFLYLGDLPGGDVPSQAFGASADGSVVVGFGNSGNGEEAFRWTSDSGMVGLGDLPDDPFNSVALGVSWSGSVVVGLGVVGSGVAEAFYWSQPSGMIGLGYLPGHNFSRANAVSGDGNFVVGISRINDGQPNNVEAFIWSLNTGLVGLGDLPGGAAFSTAHAVSGDGAVVVGLSESANGNEAFRWTAGDGMVGLGDLPGGDTRSSALGVSADGSVVVGFGNSAYGGEAFRWTAASGMIGLGDLPGAGFGSQAHAVSADGNVVVGSSFGASTGLESTLAFRWTAETGMRSIASLLVDAGIDLLGWDLTNAFGVSADGTVIVGAGFNPAREFVGWRAYIARQVCSLTSGDDICVITSSTPQAITTDALENNLGDTLQFGGNADFSFNVSSIGEDQVFRNFEFYQKVGGSNVTLTGLAGVAANWDVQEGTLTASTGNIIFNMSTVNVGGAGTFAVAASETIGTLIGTGITTISTSQTLTTGDASNHSYAGTTSGIGGLTKVGTGKFSTSSLGHSGLTTISAGELNTNGSIAGAVLISTGGTLSGTNTIGGDLTNFGVLKPGNSPGTTIVVGNYVGGGVMNVEVQLNNAGAPVHGTTHDFLTIGGAATGAATLLSIIPFAPSGTPVATTGNGIELVRVGNGGPGAGQFVLAAPLFAGPYQYVLNYVSTAGDDSYFLKSQTGEGMYGEAAMFSAGQAISNSCFHGTDALFVEGTRDTKNRGWVKVTKGNRSTEAGTGIDSEQDYDCGSGGIDVRVAGNVRVGVSGGYGYTDVDVETLAGVGKLNGDGGAIQGFMGYTEDQMFANLSIGYSSINWNFDGPLTPLTSATTSGVIGHLQAGILWPIGDWRMGAMAEIGYSDMTCGQSCLLPGTVEDAANWSARATLRLDGYIKSGALKPFVALSFSDNLGDASTLSNGGVIITTDTASGIINANAGITAKVAENAALFLDGGLTKGINTDVSGVDGTVGVKLFW
jgi:probable HAF family extracellular repeat protein